MGETALFKKVEVQDTEIMSKRWSITKTQKLNAALQDAAPPSGAAAGPQTTVKQQANQTKKTETAAADDP